MVFYDENQVDLQTAKILSIIKEHWINIFFGISNKLKIIILLPNYILTNLWFMGII